MAPSAESLLRKTSDTETFKYDYQTLRTQLQCIPGLDKIPATNEINAVGVPEAREADKEDVTANPAAFGSAVEDLRLPPKWKSARDSEGRVYYYHTKTRVSQWYPPAWEGKSDDSSDSAGEDGDDVEFKKRRRKRSSQEQAEFDVSIWK